MKTLQLLMLGIGLSFGACMPENDKRCIPAPLQAETLATAQVEPLWKAFRKRFPYHIQTIGCSEVYNDSSCVFILAEPTPHTTLGGLESLLTCYPHHFDTKHHSIGYDGWATDITIIITGVPPTEIDRLKHQISDYVFGTAYGSYFLQLQPHYATSYAPALAQSLNYQLAPNELDHWFMSNSAVPFENGTLMQLLNKASETASTLHYSQKHGFIAWILPKHFDITSQTNAIRQFALDAEMIIGAISNEKHLAIIARERHTSVYDLPPLRTETMLLLAAADDQQLAQSYERNHILACKLTNGKDWAPIFLSDELIDTEYGSLLNITDQLLKSWSQNGETRYTNFDYPKPQKWGFDKPLSNIIDEKLNNKSLTFNWNTAGAVYQLSTPFGSVFGMNSTGSLPVSYIPESGEKEKKETHEMTVYEQKGYRFFSNSHDVNLFRAAQYATLYQIFKANAIHAPKKIGSPWNLYNTLESPLHDLIHKIVHLDNKALETIASKVAHANFKQIKKHMNAEKLPLLELLESSLIAEWTGSNMEKLKKLRKAAEKITPEHQSKVIHWLAQSWQIDDMDPIAFPLFQNFNDAFAKAEFLKYHFDLIGIHSEAVMENLSQANQQRSTGWIKTPSLVLSINQDGVESYGGHNIDANVLNISANKGVARGTAILKNNHVSIHPDDKTLLTPEQLRFLGLKAKKQSDMQVYSLKTNGDMPPPKPPRPVETVFADPPSPPSKRGFVPEIHALLGVEYQSKNSYIIDNQRINSCSDLYNLLFKHVNKYDKAAIEFKGFNHDAAEILIKGLEFKIEVSEPAILGFKEKPKLKRSVSKDALIPLNFGKEGIHINSKKYIFEKEPALKIGTDDKGTSFIGVELKPKNSKDYKNVFVQIKAKTAEMFDKIKAIFKKGYEYTRLNPQLDLMFQLDKELAAAGLQKKDFQLILAQTSDCIICQPIIIQNNDYRFTEWDPQTQSMSAFNCVTRYRSRFLSRFSGKQSKRLCEITAIKISIHAASLVGTGSFAISESIEKGGAKCRISRRNRSLERHFVRFGGFVKLSSRDADDALRASI